jgi:hypothetical protein
MPTAAQPSFQLLVANFSRPYPSLITGADPITAGPTKTRGGFVFAHVSQLGFSPDLTQQGEASSVVVSTTNVGWDPFKNNPPDLPEADITVASDVFAGTSASIFLGPFELVSNRDFTTGGGVAATATNIANAVNNLPGYTASVAGPTVTVEGPAGQGPESIQFRAVYRGGTENFTFVWPRKEGFLGYPTVAPMEIEFLPTTPNHYPPP